MLVYSPRRWPRCQGSACCSFAYAVAFDAAACRTRHAWRHTLTTTSSSSSGRSRRALEGDDAHNAPLTRRICSRASDSFQNAPRREKRAGASYSAGPFLPPFAFFLPEYVDWSLSRMLLRRRVRVGVGGVALVVPVSFSCKWDLIVPLRGSGCLVSESHVWVSVVYPGNEIVSEVEQAADT
ncbi:hypothetical protein HPB51_010204 [Rhipicephalus microplus]|uniref:Uncharacterized protein n=1 Tax=Rhipicephalus microplus TaxID=6941 RepID=A0A9J6F2U1_RHIMP|nr:hypothetical protein HPB51_010204 [Rhipicephalus microplus]